MFGFLKRRRERKAREKREREEALARARKAAIERFGARLGRPHNVPRVAPTIKTSSPSGTVHVVETHVYDPTPDLVTAAMLGAVTQPVYIPPLVVDPVIVDTLPCSAPVGFDPTPYVADTTPVCDVANYGDSASYDTGSYDSGSSWDSSSSVDYGSSSSDW